MTAPSAHEVTQLLQAWSDGDQEALHHLVPLVYGELRRLARHYMSGERPGHSLQTTELINEAYMRLVEWKNVRWQNRAHFLGVAAQMMRRILVDFARSRQVAKRGGGTCRVALSEAAGLSVQRDEDFVALDDALRSLAAIDARQSRVIELRFFGGLSVEETAEVLHVSARTVMREWSVAQAWLYRELARTEPR